MPLHRENSPACSIRQERSTQPWLLISWINERLCS